MNDDREIERAEEFRETDGHVVVPIVTGESDGKGWRFAGPLVALLGLLGWRGKRWKRRTS